MELKHWTSEALNPQHWLYRDEGGANVVLAYTGNIAELQGHALRIRKRAVSDDGEKAKAEHSLEDLYAYTTLVIAPLLGAHHLEAGLLVPVNPAFLTALNEQIRVHRPAVRLSTELDPTIPVALLLPDLTQPPKSWLKTPQDGPIISVELKPKWGFLPQSPYLNKAHRSVKTTSCRFCMHQYLKGASVSEYCPLELYATDLERVVGAITKLARTPQNNLKIYRDRLPILLQSKEAPGETVTDRLARLDSGLADIFLPMAGSDSKMSHIESFARILGAIILKTNILQDVRSVQLLDDLDIDGIYEVRQHLIEQMGEVAIDGNWAASEWTTSGHDLLTAIKGNVHTPTADWRSLSNDALVQKLRQFLISATLKDCSVMITMQRYEPLENTQLSAKHLIYDEDTNTWYQFKATVIDTDPKFCKSIPKYKKLDQEIVDNFVTLNIEKSCCSD